MAEYVLQLTKQEQLTISAAVADKLIRQGDGDAALLYLLLLRHHGRIGSVELSKALRFSAPRLEAAEKTLAELGLLGEKQVELAPAEEKPDYSQLDIAERLEGDETFRLLRTEVEKLLGRRMTTADCTILLGLYDHLSLPADVIYQLVCHCVERSERAYGAGRRPTLRQIEKEGYIWQRRGIDSIPRANAYLKTYHQRQGLLPAYMRALQLGERNPVPSEEKYLTEWMDMGFPPEVVALAYDRTMLRCHELKWSYLGGILKKWNDKGLRTVEAIEQGENKPAAKQNLPGAEENDIQKYVQKMHRKR
ncbi:MAG: DnaD domain protein [Oscillospiraceae bacterium]|nr:DnaD domain protein [Oscillospiraceae bacterium]